MIELTENTIDTAKVLAQVCDPECGAQVLFIGTTRQWTQRPAEITSQPTDNPLIETEFLQYEAYREMAVNQMRKLEETARRTWPLKHVAMVHRLGRVEPSEASVAVAVSCPHRSEAFEAAKWLIDELKHHVPIWKQEHYVQTGSEWIHPTSGNCHCPSPSIQTPPQVESQHDAKPAKVQQQSQQ